MSSSEKTELSVGEYHSRGVAVCICAACTQAITPCSAPDSHLGWPPILSTKKPASDWARYMSPTSQTATFGFQVLVRKFGVLLIAIRIRTIPAQTIHINN